MASPSKGVVCESVDPARRYRRPDVLPTADWNRARHASDTYEADRPAPGISRRRDLSSDAAGGAKGGDLVEGGEAHAVARDIFQELAEIGAARDATVD
ncbi:hypothetical protein [Labrys miyagiensis]|uniref:hypothetical protein n=1 Tax=Labrys miyagiensis TaxID=346912 RepID=UPI0024E046D1|nr:hypothetical protein [Labrys miyagiensis]